MRHLSLIQLLLLLLSIEVSRGQDDKLTTITVRIDGDIEFVISDPAGNRSGFNLFDKVNYVEINDSYGVMSIDSEDPDVEAPPSVNEFTTDEPLEGRYSLTLFGTRPTKYRLSIVMIRTLSDGGVSVFHGLIDSGQTQEYSFEYTPEVGKEYLASRLIESSSLRQDLENCYKLTLLGTKPLFIDLDHRVSKYEEYIEKDESAKARHELEKLDKKLDEVYEKTSKGNSADPNHFIKEDAYRILKEDVKSLTEGH